MKKHPLHIAFLWHMHQPYYRDPKTGKYILPWVRLHGIKGYTDMLAAVEQFGGEGITFNFVPCLLEQLTDIASENEMDLYFDLSQKTANTLDQAEKKIILKHFFSANYANMVQPYIRYRELLRKKGKGVTDKQLDQVCREYTTQDFLDLQVWFNLTWFGWAAEAKYDLIPGLKKKGRNYTESEKNDLLRLQLDTLKEIIPAYRSAWQEGAIEIATSPYYHPILPLVIDNRIASISQPNDPMPASGYNRESDAALQLSRGREYVASLFSMEPVGLWPSEGSVSPAACELAGKAGFEWMASDESVLMATLQRSDRENMLYRNYRTEDNGPTIVFRDKILSDAIGFRYSSNTAKAAVNDLIAHLSKIAESPDKNEERIVPIILDGENAWEYFPDGGYNFFKELYSRLRKDKRFQLTTIGNYISEHPAKETLPSIFPASWINGSFRIWIGDPFKNRAWDLMADTVNAFEEQDKSQTDSDSLRKAHEWLLRAEGSDWFWWYGQPNSSDFDHEFDYLFRANLVEVYKELGIDPPEDLSHPITEETKIEKDIALFPISPLIDGKETHYYEWVGARVINAGDSSGSMNFTSSLMERLLYGISSDCFYLRLDFTDKAPDLVMPEIYVIFTGLHQAILSIRNLKLNEDIILSWQAEKPPSEECLAAFNKVLEIGIPFTNLIPEGEKVVEFAISLKQKNLEVERWPREGFYICPCPTQEYLNSNWVV